MAFLSHAHYDHSGGLGEFFKRNQRAKLYLRREALEYGYYKITETVKKDNGFSRETAEKYRDPLCFRGGRSAGDSWGVAAGPPSARTGRAFQESLYV